MVTVAQRQRSREVASFLDQRARFLARELGHAIASPEVAILEERAVRHRTWAGLGRVTVETKTVGRWGGWKLAELSLQQQRPLVVQPEQPDAERVAFARGVALTTQGELLWYRDTERVPRSQLKLDTDIHAHGHTPNDPSLIVQEGQIGPDGTYDDTLRIPGWQPEDPALWRPTPTDILAATPVYGTGIGDGLRELARSYGIALL